MRCEPSTASTSRSRRAPSWACSGPTVPARRRPCASSPPCCAPTPAGRRCWASTSSRTRQRCAAGSGCRVSTPRWTRTSPAARTCGCSAGSTSCPSPTARDRATELLEQFDLSDAGDRVAKTYSGGMRRRLDLASALIGTARAAVPRRAHHRPRPPQPTRHVGSHPRPGARRLDAAADDPVPRGGRRARRHHRGRRPRQDHRPRHRRRAQGPGRRRAGRGRRARPGVARAGGRAGRRPLRLRGVHRRPRPTGHRPDAGWRRPAGHGDPRPRRGTASASTTSDCAGPPSTTSSSASPATWPRRRPPRPPTTPTPSPGAPRDRHHSTGQDHSRAAASSPTRWS